MRLTRNCSACNVWPRRPINRPESSPDRSIIGPPDSESLADQRVRLTLTPAASKIRPTAAVATPAAVVSPPSVAVGTPASFRPADTLLTRTLADSEPIPRKPVLPLLSISTSASSRSASSSFSPSSIASSAVGALITISVISSICFRLLLADFSGWPVFCNCLLCCGFGK